MYEGRSGKQLEAIAIGASAGAIEALRQVLPMLPATFPWPLFVVVHIPNSTPSMLAPLFQARCALRVCEAEDKTPIERGTVYFCPSDYHLLVESKAELALSVDGPVQFSRPSIDVMFESVAYVYGARALGIVMSGANDDGARGLAAITAAGGMGMVQHPDSAQSRTMPEAAHRAAPSAWVLPPDQMADALVSLALDVGQK